MSSINSIDHCKRKLLLLSLASVASAYTVSPSVWAKENPPDAKDVHRGIRPPAIGQQWVYQVRNLFIGSVIDDITETVVSIAPQIEIRRVSRKHGPLASEVHSSWGLISRDPYWSPAVEFLKPIPLWPQAADGGKSDSTQYQVDEDSGTYKWTSKLTPRGSETIALAIGQFSALKYADDIHYQSSDLFRRECSRHCTTWLSPEIGRWVRRITRGTFFDWSEWYGAYHPEDYLQYELTSWK